MLIENEDGDLAQSPHGKRESGRKVEDYFGAALASIGNGGCHLSWGNFHLQDNKRARPYPAIAERIRLEGVVRTRGDSNLVEAFSIDPHRGEPRATGHGLEPAGLDAEVRERGACGLPETIAAHAANERREGSISGRGDGLVGSLTTNRLTEGRRQHCFTGRRQVRDAKSQVDIDRAKNDDPWGHGLSPSKISCYCESTRSLARQDLTRSILTRRGRACRKLELLVAATFPCSCWRSLRRLVHFVRGNAPATRAIAASA